jgi:hypothetical protein
VNAVKTDDNTYEAWISTSEAEKLVDITAVSESLGAMVQIDGNAEAARHIDTQSGVTAPVNAKTITVTATDGTEAEYALNVHLIDLELKSVQSDGAEYHPTTLTEIVDGKATDIYEIYTEKDYTELEIIAKADNANLTAGMLPDGAAEPTTNDSNRYYRPTYALNEEGYTEIQVKVGMENIPSEFDNIAYLRIYKMDDNNNLDYIDVTYDNNGESFVTRAEAIGDNAYAVIVPEGSAEVDIKAVAESKSTKVSIAPHTTAKTSYDEYEDYQLKSDKTNVDINLYPSSGDNNAKYTLTIYRANTDLESVKVAGKELHPTVKTEVLNGTTIYVYEVAVEAEQASIFTKAVSNTALVNVSEDGALADNSASSIWQTSSYEIETVRLIC